MTTRYGPLFASFWEWDDPTYTAISTGAPSPVTYLEVESAEIVKKLGQMTRGRFTAARQDNWEFFLQEGRLVSLYQGDEVLGESREMGAFVMEKVRPKLGADGRMKIDVSGLGREKLLTRYRHWAPVGEETLYVTTVAANAPATWTTTVAGAGIPTGNDHVTVTNMGAAQVGDVIRIEMENSAWFVGKITDIEPPGAPENTIIFEPRIPYSSFGGRDVEFRKARIVVADMTGMAAGLEIQILLDSLAVHQTLIADVSLDTSAVILKAGLPSASSIGKQVTTYDYSQPATDDVTQIMAGAEGWELAFGGAYTGTENGTAHQPEGDSVWELLTAAAEQSGEFFRIAPLDAGKTPRKKILWRRTHDSSGMSLALYLTSWEVGVATENINIGVIHEIERDREHNVITRVYPVGADGRVSLAYATEAARAEAAAAGFTIGTGPGLYGKDYVEYDDGVEEHGVLSDVVRYGNVTLSDKGAVSELQAAADSMLRQAMTTILESQEREYWRVKVHTHRPLFPGQTVLLANTAMEPETGGTVTMYVLEVREVIERGAIMSYLLLSKEAQIRPTATVLLGRQLLSAKQAALRPVGRGKEVVGAIVTVGGGGATDHGALTGLRDVVDHPDYLLADGTRTLTGNLGAAASVTIDGVDISAHAADPDAHHTRATSGNSAISVAGQSVSGVVHANGGLEISGGLQAKLPASSGLIKDGTGLYTVAPANISASSTNSRDGGTHAVTAASNVIGAAGESLLKGDATGALSVDRLGVGVAANTAAALYAQSRAVDDYTLWLKQINSQTADIWRVEDKDGNALIRLTGGGDLESGKPGFVSGQTGWQMTATGDLEVNNARIRGELHATVFVADEMHVVGGTLLVKTGGTVAPPRAGQANDNKLPAINSTFALVVNASWDGGLNYFPVDSILRIKPMGEIASGGSLDLYDFQLQVTAVSAIAGRDLANGNPGYFVLTCNRRLGGETGFDVPTGAAIVRWTEVGASGHTGAIKLTADGDVVDDATEAPLLDVFTVGKKTNASWAGVAPVVTPRVRLGNLRGVLGKSADEWGLAASTDLSSTNVATPSLVASDLGLNLRNIDLKMYSGANPTVEWQADGDLKAGTDIGADATTSMEFRAATGYFRAGFLVAGKPNLTFDGSDLKLRIHTTDVIVLDSSGSSYFAGPMTIGASGGIYQGGGTFASPTAGLKVWNSGGDGRLSTFHGSVEKARLNQSGLQLLADTADFTKPSSITWSDSIGGTAFASIGANSNNASADAPRPDSSKSSLAFIKNGANAKVVLSGGTTRLILDSSNDYALLINADLYVQNRGVAVGYTATPALNRGQIASDFAGEHSYNALVLQDTGQIAHGMTDVVGTATYGALGKASDTTGGLQIIGAAEGVVGAHLWGYGVTENTTTGTGAAGAVIIAAAKRDGAGPGVAVYGDTANLLVVRNSASAKFIVKGNGNFHYDGAGSAYDEHDDVGLLRTLARELWPGTIESMWDRFVTANRQNLVEAGVLSEGGFINGAALNRLLVGAMWQLNERVRRMEEACG